MSLTQQPWMKPGVNYSDISHAPQYCKEDGGVWNATGKWCTPVPGSNFTNLFGNATEHGHVAIGYYNKAPRSYFSPSFRLMALLASVVILLSSAVSGSPIDKEQRSTLGPVFAQEKLSNGTYSPQAQPCIKYAQKVGDGNPHQSCRWK